MAMTDLYATVKAAVESIQSLVVTQKAQVPTIDFDKQFQAVKRRLQQLHDLSSSQATELSGLVCAGPRTSLQKGDLLDEINGRLVGSTASGSGARKPPQEVASFAPFLTRGDVCKLRSDAGDYVKLEIVAARATSLGIVRPSEQSFKAGVCICILSVYVHLLEFEKQLLCKHGNV